MADGDVRGRWWPVMNEDTIQVDGWMGGRRLAWLLAKAKLHFAPSSSRLLKNKDLISKKKSESRGGVNSH